MSLPRTVVRFDYWYHPSMAETFAAAGVDLVTCARDAPDGQALQVFARAHAYQITAARDELPRRWFADARILEAAPNLLCVSSIGAGYDTIDVAACTEAGVLVVNQAGANARSVAEHTLGLMLDLAKRISENDRCLRASRGYSREDLMGREIGGKTLGLVGIGHVGRRVARLAGAFDMEVLASDPYLDADEVARRGAVKVELDDLLTRADYVSLHCPRTALTEGMIDAGAFARMKPGARFVSTARGGIHDEAALLEALESGHLAGAGLDVWDIEPPPLDQPLLRRHDVVATYHTAGVTHEARANMASWSARQVLQVLDGERPPRLLNPEAWERFAKRYAAVFGRPVRS
ncbi:MAG: hydroxyacid dehydrogenase [Pseudomonadota bacterium]